MKIHLLFISIIIMLTTNEMFSQTEKPALPLTFHISGFESDAGQVLLMLYRKQDNVPKSPNIKLKAEIVNREAIIEVRDLPYGDYAAIVAHDLNKNNMIDHKWGIPSEPLGYTNNWKLSLFSGMPTFEKLKFSFTKSNFAVRIRMKS